MARKKVLSLRCPTCRKLVLRGEPTFPFCSDRCKTIDLGKWASDAYVISSPLAQDSSEAEYPMQPEPRPDEKKR